jgi:hypothetical protein
LLLFLSLFAAVKQSIYLMNELKKIIGCFLLLSTVAQSYAQKAKSPDFIFTDTALFSGNAGKKVCIKDLEVIGTKKNKDLYCLPGDTV